MSTLFFDKSGIPKEYRTQSVAPDLFGLQSDDCFGALVRHTTTPNSEMFGEQHPKRKAAILVEGGTVRAVLSNISDGLEVEIVDIDTATAEGLGNAAQSRWHRIQGKLGFAHRLESITLAPETTQDAITDILLEAYKAGGLGEAKKTLRCALTNFAAECGKTAAEVAEGGDPDPEILAELSVAVVTPCYLQEN